MNSNLPPSILPPETLAKLAEAGEAFSVLMAEVSKSFEKLTPGLEALGDAAARANAIIEEARRPPQIPMHLFFTPDDTVN